MDTATEMGIHKGTAEVKYHLLIRTLHVIIAFGIAIQFMLSLIMQPPEPGHVRSAFESLAFEVYETLGPAMWTYLVLHAGAAMAHTSLGHGSVLSVFRLYHHRASNELGLGLTKAPG